MSPNKIALLLLLISFNISVINGLKGPFSELKKFFETAVSLVAEKVKEAVELVKCTFSKEACCKETSRPCLDQKKACYRKCGNKKQQCDDECTKCTDGLPSKCKDEFADVCFPSGHEKEFKDTQKEEHCRPVECLEALMRCTKKQDACYSTCGSKKTDCEAEYSNCWKSEPEDYCKLYLIHGINDRRSNASFKRLQDEACKKQKKTFKQIPADELEKPENGQMEKSVGVNSSDVPPNATTTALTAIPLP